MSGSIGRLTEEQVRREMIRTERREERRRTRIGALVILALAVLVGALAVRFVFVLTDIRTTGMSDALHSGDVVLCEREGSLLGALPISRGAMVLVKYRDNGMNRQTVRRIVAVGGDEVSVEPDGHVTVNGEPLEEPYASYRSQSDWGGGNVAAGGALGNPFADPDAQPTQAPVDESTLQVDDVTYPLIVPEGKLFVLCDNRENSLDSRSSRFGLVGKSDVVGLVRAIIWPVYRAGMLTDVGIE